MKSYLLLGKLFPFDHIPDCEIMTLTDHSEKTSAESVFVCIRGQRFDGHTLAPRAYERGCRIFVAEEPLDLPPDACVLLTPNSRKTLSELACTLWGNPSGKMHVIGITGTKGKTTTATMLAHILNSVGIPTGYIGTNGISYGSVERTTANTTPDPLTLQQTLYDMQRSGTRAVVMEVSSQGLMQSRVAGVQFGTVLFTNLYLDHIGGAEHPTFEHYRATKHSLFTDFASPNAVWNIDDPATPFMRIGCTALRNLTVSGQQKADYLAKNTRPLRDENGLYSLFRLIAEDKEIECRLQLLGEHNVYNALLAIAVAHGVFQIPIAVAVEVLEKLSIRGRAECVPLPNGALCVIDYAHNGESLRHLLTSLRAYQPSRLICLFGSVGERTQIRRRELGEVAAELADLSILTSDNPGTEDPMQIIEEIAAAFGNNRKAYIKIPDRSDAIRCAVSILQRGDILVLAGKGHEEYQLIGREKLPFSEKEIIREVLDSDPILLPQ